VVSSPPLEAMKKAVLDVYPVKRLFRARPLRRFAELPLRVEENVSL
jgi:hypothetical protein